jgi:cell division protein FtsW
MKNKIDYPLLFCTLILVGVGLIFVYSATAIMAEEKYNSSIFFLRKQLLVSILGVWSWFWLSRLKISFFKKISVPLLFISLFLLVLVLVPGIGEKINNARRWLRFGPFFFQPSELAKLSLILFFASSLSEKKNLGKSKFKEFVPYLIILGLFSLLILGEPDFGTAVILIVLIFLLLFIGGMPFRYLCALFLGTFPFLFFLIYKVSYRFQRILAFLNPWADPLKAGHQLIQSLCALGLGGWLGSGLAESKQKLGFLPASYTDFIFAIIGEEWGVVGTSFVIILFIIFIFRGVKIALEVTDLFASLFAVGFTGLISLQATVNIGVVLGLLPTTGMPLPFISYGCSSLLVNLVGVGILLNISTLPRRR